MKFSGKTLLLLACMLWAPAVVMAQKLTDHIEQLKKFPDCFSIIASNATTPEQAAKTIADPPCFRQCLLTNHQEYFLLLFFPDSLQNQLNQCYFSQRVIRGAIEMYNAEHKLPMRRINNDMISQPDSPLIPAYLKFPFPRPSKGCRYESIGDITKGSLTIYCTLHGAPARRK